MYRHILIVVADHPSSRAAVNEGVRLAQGLGARVLFAHVLHRHVVAVTDMPPVATLAPEEFERESAKLAERVLDAAMASAAEAGVAAAREVVQAANDTDGLCGLTRERGCDLVVVGSEGGNALTRLLTGSVVSGLITRSSVPVLVCHEPREAREAAAAAAAERAAEVPPVPPFG